MRVIVVMLHRLEPRVVMEGQPHGIRLAAAGDTLHLVAITPGDFRILYVREKEPPRHVATGGGCALALDGDRAVLFWSEATKQVDVTRARHTIRTIRVPGTDLR